MAIEYLTGNSIYNNLIDLLPEHLRIIPPLFLLTISIAIYGVFIWFFYRFLSKRDVLKLNLAKYNVYKHSGLVKFLAVLFYVLEFMIIAPIVIFFWFTILSFFIIILAKDVEVGTAILIVAAIISAIRITAYLNEDLSREIAKLFPLTLLAVVVLTPGILDIGTNINRFSQIMLFFNNAIYYFLFIVALEVILRLIYLPFAVVHSEKVKENKTNTLQGRDL
jgi:hypothetical protein